MKAKIEVIILPYSAGSELTIGQLLVKELSNGRWRLFQSAVAFAKQSGNYDEILQALRAFVSNGGRVEMTFGADSFGADARGSEYEAINALLTQVGENPNFRLFLYHEKGRTFHPKLYLFSNEKSGKALLIIGSSNWSEGGFFTNIEANVAIELDWSQSEHREFYEYLQTLFMNYWQETE